MKMKRIILFLLFIVSVTVLQAQTNVQGTVASAENGETLVGATVVIKGTTKGAVTNVDGEFNLTVPSNSILKVSYIGFLAQEIEYSGEKELNISLRPDVAGLEEVVVVAYGTTKKSDLTGAVSSVKMDGLDELPVTRVDQALQGKLAGVQVLNLNPEAGAAPVIRVRGMGSISADQEPLVVVDGFPMQDGLSMVNMGDIESIEVLKDAASSALYGSRAAGGVILVTTKSGSATKTKYNFKMYAGINMPLKLPDMMSTEEYVELLFEEAELRKLDPSIDGTDATMEFNRATNNEMVAYLISKHIVDEPTDWVDEGMRDFGSIQNYQLSASGGNEKLKYYLSGNYSTEDGTMKKSSYDKYSLKTKIDVNLSDKVRVGVNFNPTYSNKEEPRVDLTDYMRFKSWMPVRHNEATAAMTESEVGEFAQVPDFYASTITGIGVDGEVWSFSGINPWSSGNQSPTSIRERTDIIEEDYKVQTNAYLEVDILPGLKFRTSNGVYFSFEEYSMKEQTEAYKAGVPNKLTREFTTYTDMLSENILSYDQTFGDHSFGGLIGFSAQKSNSRYNQIVGTGFPDEVRLSYNMASEFLKNTSSTDGITSFYSSDALLSVLSRINYTYQGKYLLSASMRADGSSKFAKGHKWGVFPSGSVGWRVSEEDFMNDIETITNFKVRASYGITGNNTIPQYSYMNTVGTIDYVTGEGNGNLVTGMSSTSASLGNNAITWEQLSETNLGIDVGIIDNRFNIALEFYNSNTIQLLLRQPAMYITGHQSSWNNIGKVNNKGFEFELTTANIDKPNFSWRTTANFSTNKNTLLNYGDKEKEDNFGERAEVYRAEVGENSIQYFGYKSDGVYTSFEEVEEALAKTDADGNSFTYAVFKPIIGGLKVANTNGDNAIDPEDRVVIGSPLPDFIWGITNDFRYRDFDLSFLIQGVQGGDIVNGNIYYNEQLRLNKAYTENRFVSPMFPGDGQTVYSTTTPGNQILLTDYPIESGSYAALRNVTLGYTLPGSLSQRFGISSMRAYFSAQNLVYLMASDYRGVNPEARKTSSQYGNPLVDGYQRGVFPLSRAFTLGVDVTF
jgi:TonB-linked SusC/RagA family outer membrane protein